MFHRFCRNTIYSSRIIHTAELPKSEPYQPNYPSSYPALYSDKLYWQTKSNWLKPKLNKPRLCVNVARSTRVIPSAVQADKLESSAISHPVIDDEKFFKDVARRIRQQTSLTRTDASQLWGSRRWLASIQTQVTHTPSYFLWRELASPWCVPSLRTWVQKIT